MTNEVEKRTTLALAAIKQAFGSDADEFGATMFVKHHLEELSQDYWQEHVGTSNPEASAVLGLLELKSNWGEDEIENLDFTLPGEITDYVVSVHFDDAGAVDGISMES